MALDEFYAAGGKASHVLHLLASRDSRPPANEVQIFIINIYLINLLKNILTIFFEVAAVFLTVEALVLRAAQEEEGATASTMAATALDLVKRTLADYGREVVLLLSGTNTAHQAKAVLRMLAAMVALGSPAAREVLARLAWDSDHWTTLPKRRSAEQPDVRTAFTRLVLAFLFDGSREVLREFLEVRTARLVSLLPGLLHDSAATVTMVLATLTARILENPKVTKTTKMRVFGSHNLKPLLGLLAWTGPKGEEAEEGEREEVVAAVTTFLTTLLGSTKLGVVFPDPELRGAANPLAREVVEQLERPWERPRLVPILTCLLSTCPAYLPAFLGKVGEAVVPRDSSTWHQVMDLLTTVLSTCLPPPTPPRPTSALMHTITSNLLLPSSLLPHLTAGVRDAEVAVVSDRCLALLALLVRGVRSVVEGVAKEGRAGAGAACRARLSLLPPAAVVAGRWREAAAAGRGEAALHALHLLAFLLEHGANPAAVQAAAILGEVETHRHLLGPAAPAVQLEALAIFQASAAREPALLASLATPATLRLLLAGATSTDGATRTAAARTLQAVVRGAGVGLPSGDDSALLLALASAEEVQVVAEVLVTAVTRKEELQEKVEEAELVRLSGGGGGAEELMQALMDPDLVEEQVEGWVVEEGAEVLLSPLLVAAVTHLPSSPAFLQEFLASMSFLVERRAAFLAMVAEVAGGRLATTLLPTKEPDPTTLLAQPSWVVVRAAVGHLLHLAKEDEEQEQKLLSLLQLAAPDTRKRLIKTILAKKSVVESFDPFLTAAYDPSEPTSGGGCGLVLGLLRVAREAGVEVATVRARLLAATAAALARPLGTEGGEQVREAFALAGLTAEQVVDVLEQLLLLPVTDFSTKFPVTDLFAKARRHTTAGHLVAGACCALAALPAPALHAPALAPLLHRLSGHLEVLLDSTEGEDVASLASCLTALLERAPQLAASLADNLSLVCAAHHTPQHLALLAALVGHSAAHLEAFKAWVYEDKQRMSRHFWPLIPKLFGAEGATHEKKFVTIVLKRVVKEVEVALSSEEEVAGLEELGSTVELLCRHTRSEKQVELWVGCLGARHEAPRPPPPPRALLLRWTVLATLHRHQGGQDTRVAREVFLPALAALTTALRPPKEGTHDLVVVEELARAAADSRAVTENKTLAKELGRSTEVWEGFRRAALRHCLRLGEAGAPPLALLTQLVTFLQAGGKLGEAATMVDMVTSHSSYLPVLMGPSCRLKSSLVLLLVALAPASLRAEQVPVVLAAYSATLHPSDTALLALLRLHEGAGGLASHLPLVWGAPAAAHYSATDWKAPKATELLVLLDREKVKATCTSFPLHLAMEEEQEQEEASWHLYDPRFLLPWLSHLLQEVRVDKHMKLVEGGALHLALALTSSTAPCTRSAAFHLLHLLHTSLEAAKLAQEKQVWLHLLSLVRHGVVGRSRNTRLPSLLTTYLGGVVDTLLAPLSPLYRPLARALVAKPALDTATMPEFLRLFRSPRRAEQAWLLDTLRRGLRTNQDYKLLARTFAPKLLLAQWGGGLMDDQTNALVLEVVEAMVATNYGCVDLVARQGLLAWLVVAVEANPRVASAALRVVERVGEGLRGVDRRREEAGEEWENLEAMARPGVALLVARVGTRGREEDRERMDRIKEHWSLTSGQSNEQK